MSLSLTVSLSAFWKKEDQQLPDEPHPDDEKVPHGLAKITENNHHAQMQQHRFQDLHSADVCKTTRALTAQGIWRTAEPWLVSAAIVQAGTDSTQSERSAGTGLKSREASGRPRAADKAHVGGEKDTQT